MVPNTNRRKAGDANFSVLIELAANNWFQSRQRIDSSHTTAGDWKHKLSYLDINRFQKVVLSTVSQSCDPPVAAPRFVPKQIPKVEVAQPVGSVLIIKRSANDGTSQQFGSFHSPSSLAGPCGTLDRHRGDRLSLLDRQLHLCLPASSRSGGSLYVTIDTNSNTQPKNH
jgi:hypothetical protein